MGMPISSAGESGGQMEELRHFELGDREGWEGPFSAAHLGQLVLGGRDKPRIPFQEGIGKDRLLCGLPLSPERAKGS